MSEIPVTKRAKHWWRRAEVWLLAGLFVISGVTIGYQLGMYSAQRLMTAQLADIRQAYDDALGRKDKKLETLVETTSEAAKTAAQAAETASQAASKAAEGSSLPGER
ncbi:hypothetical protein [Phytopseudomonas punonensis]|uniref:Lipoprotein n=1 Tax=Phytopseudomonas punonensis TaxID=1220495 RepID=A0A1M7LHU8_9GAMM|nr:hypothetical protein [Pseudomonas punonensis]SHM77599.1 hypothetical protein SAMN05216288_4266 [Pseudomonas punonensis]